MPAIVLSREEVAKRARELYNKIILEQVEQEENIGTRYIASLWYNFYCT
jgi:hypothetical protein